MFKTSNRNIGQCIHLLFICSISFVSGTLPPQSYSFSQGYYNPNSLPHPLPLPPQPSFSSLRAPPVVLSQRRLSPGQGSRQGSRQDGSSSPSKNSPRMPMYPIVTGSGGDDQSPVSQFPSYDYHATGNTADTNALLLDFLYDYYEYSPNYGQGQGQGHPLLPIPPDYGWIWPPSPPPTTLPETHPVTEPSVSMMPSYKPFKPKPPPHHHHPHPHKPGQGHGHGKDKDTTDEDSATTDEDDDDSDKKPDGGLGEGQVQMLPPPASLFQFGLWRPPSISEGAEEYKSKFERLKAKWNRLLDRLKIQESLPPEKESEIVNRRPIKGSGSGGGNDFPISSSATNTKFQLEQLPGWNTPPLRNPGQVHIPPWYPTPIRQTGSNYNYYKGWAPLPTRRPALSYPIIYSPYNKYYK